MANFKQGDKALVVIGTYPNNYRGVKFEPEPELVGTQVIVTDGGHHYFDDAYVPDYSISDEAGNSLGLIDEVHLQLVAEPVVKLPEPQQYVVDSALAGHAFEILERIEAKLTAIEERLAAHEARSNQSTGVVINVTGNVSMPAEMPAEMAAIAPEPSVEPEPVGSVTYHKYGEWQAGYWMLQLFSEGTIIEVEYLDGTTGTFRVHETDIEYHAPRAPHPNTDYPLCLVPIDDEEHGTDWTLSEGILRARAIYS